MNSTSLLVWTGAGIGSIIGSYLPKLWGSGLLSFSSIILGTIGGLLGVYVGYKISQNI